MEEEKEQPACPLRDNMSQVFELTVVGDKQCPQALVVVELAPRVPPVVQVTAQERLLPGHVTNSHSFNNIGDTVKQ